MSNAMHIYLYILVYAPKTSRPCISMHPVKRRRNQLPEELLLEGAPPGVSGVQNELRPNLSGAPAPHYLESQVAANHRPPTPK